LKRSPVITGREQIDIAVHGLGCRAVESQHIPVPCGESLHSTATARPCFLRPGFCLGRKRLAAVFRPRYPDTPPRLTHLTGSFCFGLADSVPGDVDISIAVSGDCAAAIESKG